MGKISPVDRVRISGESGRSAAIPSVKPSTSPDATASAGIVVSMPAKNASHVEIASTKNCY
jgi:hypothetical protein